MLNRILELQATDQKSNSNTNDTADDPANTLNQYDDWNAGKWPNNETAKQKAFYREPASQIESSFPSSQPQHHSIAHSLAQNTIEGPTFHTNTNGKHSKNSKSKSKYTNEPSTKDTIAQDNKNTDGLSDFFVRVSQLRNMLNCLQASIREVDAIQAGQQHAIRASNNSTEFSTELAFFVSQANSQANSIRTGLKQMQAELEEEKRKMPTKSTATQSSRLVMKNNQWQSLMRRYVDIMKDYQAIQMSHRAAHKKRLHRHILIIKPNADATEIQQLLDHGIQNVFGREMLLSSSEATSSSSANTPIKTASNSNFAQQDFPSTITSSSSPSQSTSNTASRSNSSTSNKASATAMVTASGITITANGTTINTRQLLQDILEQHDEIVRIEQSIIELQQLFLDMAVLIEAQGEVILSIEEQVGQTVDNTEAGVTQLRHAVKLQRKSRKKMFIVIGVLAMLIAVGLSLIFGIFK